MRAGVRGPASPPPGFRLRGRPILGGTAGAFLGVFLAYDLFVLGHIASDSALVVALPIVLMVVGIALGFFAPLRWRR